MGHNRNATSLFIGILICVPMLALYHFGVFVQAAQWIAERLPRYLVLPADGVHLSKPLQYAYYTFMAFSSAWLALTLPQAWKKYLYLLGIAFLTFLMTPVLALNGILFEPFSGTLAAWFAGLLGLMLSDTLLMVRDAEPKPAQATAADEQAGSPAE
jgi:hypothetical protein